MLLTRDGTPKITDFGLARRLDGSVDQTLGYLKTGSARVKRAALAPIRAANGLASGTSAAISALVRRPKLPGR